ncbi:MAG: GDSL-type esterase/lipase family protein [Planctomycetota bacterium]|nr:GDSL-type esterase/lipase family protein [Planctomycetota bacterium]
MRSRNATLWVAVLLALLAQAGYSGEGALIDSMDDVSFAPPKEKGALDLVEGKVGKAVKFSFSDQCSGVWFMGKARGKPEWDAAAGFSFWVKGDGSNHLGGLQFVWNENYDLRYTYAFPIDSTDWKKITVAWRDLVPALPHPQARLIDPKNGNAPSKLGNVWIGKWFFWKDYAAHSYAVDEIRLEPALELDANEYKPDGAPLARVLAKVKAKQPITIVTMGDSLTDYAHWANKATNWPTILKSTLKEKFGVEATIVNPAVGGSLLRHGLIVMPRWLKEAPEPDLVTVCYGFNDHDSKMTGELFLDAQKDAVDRIRRATKGKADVLIITTCPAVSKWDSMADMAEACRKAAAEKNAGICDIYAAFHEAGKENKERLYCDDKTHMGKPGHELIAAKVVEALEKGGKQ